MLWEKFTKLVNKNKLKEATKNRFEKKTGIEIKNTEEFLELERLAKKMK